MTEPLTPGEETVAAMRERFGDEKSDEYLRLIKAMRALIHAWGAFCQADEDSFDEAVALMQVEKMQLDMRQNPEHHEAITEGLLAIIVAVLQGGSVEAWFGQVGVDFWDASEETKQ